MKTDSDNQKKQWNQFIDQNNGSFLQSWQWGQFQQSLGRKIWPIEIEEELKGLVIRHNLPLRKSYLYCPRGPIIGKSQAANHKFQAFLEEIKKIAKQENSIFFQIELGETSPQKAAFKEQSLRAVPGKQPLKTIILDIAKPEEITLAQMHHKTRYNIRLAQRKGVVIEQATNDKQALNTFLNLLEETAKRDKFRPYPKKYYQKMLEVLGKEGMIKLFVAKHQDQIIAANLVCFFGQTATYLHGASDYSSRQIMAPYLLQWQVICQAKEAGLKYYDFWGIDEEKWPGVTRFKKGFGGQEVTYSGAFDLTFQSAWYRLYQLAKRIL